MISVNDALPAVTVYHSGDNDAVESSTLLNKGTVVLIGVPAAFSPTCTDSHLPGYIKESANLKMHGVDSVACISVNDRFVMNAWGRQLGTSDAGIVMIADAAGDLTRALDVEIDLSAIGLGMRSLRYAIIARDGVVQYVAIEENPGKLDISSAESILQVLKA